MYLVNDAWFGKLGHSLWTVVSATSEPTLDLKRLLFPKTSASLSGDPMSLEPSTCLTLRSAAQPHWKALYSIRSQYWHDLRTDKILKHARFGHGM